MAPLCGGSGPGPTQLGTWGLARPEIFPGEEQTRATSLEEQPACWEKTDPEKDTHSVRGCVFSGVREFS